MLFSTLVVETGLYGRVKVGSLMSLSFFHPPDWLDNVRGVKLRVIVKRLP